jgi:hypothetical protein
MHGPLNVKSVCCLVMSGRNILLGEEQKGNEQLHCVRKKYFHFVLNECSCLEDYSLYVGVLNTICLFVYLRIGD